MRIHKILNNNVVVAIADRGGECVAIGNGIAFGLHAGDEIDERRVDRLYTPRGEGVIKALSELVETIPLEHLKVCDEIIHMAARELDTPVAERLMLSLIDHIAFAIERHEVGIDLTTGLRWVMEQAYPREYAVGLLALTIIDKRLGMRLAADEAAFIAFHLVNAGSSTQRDQDRARDGFAEAVTLLVTDVLGVQIDRDSFEYGRFATHLRMFAARLERSTKPIDQRDEDDGLIAELESDHPDIAVCVTRIVELTVRTFGHAPTAAERSYLLAHIHRLRSTSNLHRKSEALDGEG